ncbi:TonB-dependent receptor domain-containing protein [Winogradskyella endarachnes]|uniref:TonB-dependent receptor plug domain-containing protein n=1 Tax=Winogradskyella endarachnes TaxID=2681965 RepID=A0A6L6UCU8_9FLAO|nr:TonB-dependent receptor [Winogradskyella endarachnes]MUU79789.1 TonB-dependent receptor plug domain-containing protein [Winogradskyella endarachnes]
MKLKVYNTLLLVLITISAALAQSKVSGFVTSQESNTALSNVEIFEKASGLLAKTDNKGYFEFTTTKQKITLVFFSYEFQVEEVVVSVNGDTTVNQSLVALGEQLTAVEITARKAKVFELSRLNDVEETAIYAGKKTEVILVGQSMANLASNNARQIYSQVAGLNIFQNDDAGLQLNIGGRGLDPNRTSNFNTRQNGYDISADVLGYPESYYTPPAEALEQIQVVRGAASLQYGTQFGGLINFIFKKPNPNKTIEFITRNTFGSNGLYTNFTSLSGTKEKFSYYTYFNYKKGDGFRPNSEFESKNAFMHLGYQLFNKTKLSGELTYMRYLAQQAGGLSDAMFNEDAFQSNRTRNWFQVDWLLYSFKIAHEFSENTNFTFNFFGLDAERNALGFRTNRQDIPDNFEERDLIIGEYNNFGFEARLLNKYKFFGKEATALIGTKFYKADNTSIQGPGSDGIGPDFQLQLEDYPNYENQSNFSNPNLNVAVFGENIFYLNDKWSVTPGFRLEYIKTESDGYSKRINLDGAGNVILNETEFSDELNERSFVLFGLGTSYKPNENVEFYANASQNYRSVTFSDINLVNPNFSVRPLEDETGLTGDLGFRGNYKGMVSFDISAFSLFYNDRIGITLEVQNDNSVRKVRDNIGDAFIFGLESLIDFNLNKLFIDSSKYRFNYFINTSLIHSEYTKSEETGIEGNQVEFVPQLNLKTGLKFGYQNFQTSVQYTYISDQFSDAPNSGSDPLGSSGIIGLIPEYDILDFSLSYQYKQFKLETGINNLLNNTYFTRRATGYPGPGILPSPPRNWYATLEIKI